MTATAQEEIHPNEEKPKAFPPSPPALVNAQMVRFYFVPVSERKLYEMISEQKFPAPDVKIGALRFWKRENIQAWVNQL